ncbi:MAG: 50S ribosomal protein L11 methyltransferase [Bacilli bacterium]|nr:50S ribosomal protein L11 methyltransferase [Bacilli bacterium]
MNKDYENLLAFWNQSLKLNEDEFNKTKGTIDPDKDWESLAPSTKLIDALKELKDATNVLDYGCGSGWASIVLAKLGAQKITATEVAPNAIQSANAYIEAFGETSKIKTLLINEVWLKEQSKHQYDGFYCSNVIDVVPLSMAKDIIASSYEVTAPLAKVIFSTNYYIDPEKMKERGFQVDGTKIYIDGILRLNSLTDEEWTNIFKTYYKKVDIRYFAWPGEKEEHRRIFILSK